MSRLPARPRPILSDSDKARFWTKVQHGDGCWLWTGAHNQRGYGFLSFGHRPDRFNIVAHVVAWAIEHGEWPDPLSVLHRCDNPGCVRPDHLWRGTQGDNMRDAAAKGRVVSRPFNERRPHRSYAGAGNPHWKGGVGYRWRKAHPSEPSE